MVRSTLALLLLAPCALASSSFSGLRSLNKRQTLSGDATQQIQGLLTLAQQVLTDAQSGNISSACSGWSQSLIGCEGSAGQNQVALASCACGSQVIDQLNSCASSYGSTGTSAASGFQSFCQNTLPSIAQTGLTSYVGASSTSSGSASQASASGSSSSNALSALSSSASSIISAASSVASSASNSAQSAAPSDGSSGGTSGASKEGIVAGSLGFVSLVAFMLA
ncbi:hypothetical protein JCM5350_005943 [Sporobolomyces pararoseus]